MMKKTTFLFALTLVLVGSLQAQISRLGAGFEIDSKNTFPNEYYAIGSIGGNISGYFSHGMGIGFSISIQKPINSSFVNASLPYDGMESISIAGLVGLGFNYKIIGENGFLCFGPAINTLYSENGKMGYQSTIYGMAIRNEIGICANQKIKISIPFTIGYGYCPEVVEIDLPNRQIWITTSINIGI
jgi:hypothetical protein